MPQTNGSEAPRLSRLQRERSRVTKRKLLEAASRLAATNGFEATTVADICEEAGVAKGTFYFYFPRKEDILLEMGLITSDRVAAETLSALEGDEPTIDILRRAITGIASRVQRTPKDLLELTILELHRRRPEWPQYRGERHDFASIFTAIFWRAQQRGEIPSEFGPRELASMLGPSILNGMAAWATDQVFGVPLEVVLWRRALVVYNGAKAGLGLDAPA